MESPLSPFHTETTEFGPVRSHATYITRQRNNMKSKMAAMQAACARHVAEQNLKRKVGRYAAALGFIVLMFPGPINAQKIEESNSEHGERGQHHRYKLVDIGTFGGPNSVLTGPSTIAVNNQGTYAGQAETGTPDPNAPNCQNPECLIYHAQKW